MTNSVGFDVLSNRAFPIYYADVDSILKIAAGFLKAMTVRKNENFYFGEVGAGKSVFMAHMARKNSYYRIVLRTDCGNIVSSMVIVNERSHKKAMQRLRIFTDYLKNNISVLSN